MILGGSTRIGILFGFALVASACGQALGRPDFEREFLRAVRPEAGSALGSAHCGVCHAGVPPNLNLYGIALQSALRNSSARGITDAVIARTADLDSDGDGFANSSELKSGTLPGDPNSNSKALATAANGGSTIDLFVPGHSFHPLIIHFSVALLVFGAILEIAGARGGRPEWRSAGFVNVLAAALVSPVAVISGVAALFRESLPLDGVALLHLGLGSASTLAVILTALRGVVENRGGRGRNSRLYWTLLVVAVFAVSAAGHFGSILVFG